MTRIELAPEVGEISSASSCISSHTMPDNARHGLAASSTPSTCWKAAPDRPLLWRGHARAGDRQGRSRIHGVIPVCCRYRHRVRPCHQGAARGRVRTLIRGESRGSSVCWLLPPHALPGIKATHEAVDIVRTPVLSFPRICSIAWWYCGLPERLELPPAPGAERFGTHRQRLDRPSLGDAVDAVMRAGGAVA